MADNSESEQPRTETATKESQPNPEDSTSADERRLVFSLDNTSECLFACSTVGLSEVMSIPEILRIPRTKPWFLGLCGHRGHLVTVNDLRAFLFGVGIEPDKRARIIILDHEDSFYGFFVSSIKGFCHFSPVEHGENYPESGHGHNWAMQCLNELAIIGEKDSAFDSQSKFFAINFKHIITSREFKGPGLGMYNRIG